MRRDELYHYGVRGMKWGVRKSPARKSSSKRSFKERYSNGATVYGERSRLKNEKYKSLIGKSKKYEELRKEAARIVDKYGLDADDGGGGDVDRWGEETIRRAGNRYWQIAEDMDSMSSKFYEKSRKYADDEIIKRYGDVGINDERLYSNTNAAATMALLAGGIGLSLAISSRK